MEITIKRYRELSEATQKQVIEFYREIRRTLFPMLDQSILPKDLVTADVSYSDANRGSLLVALDASEAILGTIGFLPYDHRFKAFITDTQIDDACELVRCYVDASYRRNGIGSLLMQAVLDEMKRLDYHGIYLHSHYFLPGGIEFWHAKGFEDILIEHESADYPTVHMYKTI